MSCRKIGQIRSRRWVERWDESDRIGRLTADTKTWEGCVKQQSSVRLARRERDERHGYAAEVGARSRLFSFGPFDIGRITEL